METKSENPKQPNKQSSKDFWIVLSNGQFQYINLDRDRTSHIFTIETNFVQNLTK